MKKALLLCLLGAGLCLICTLLAVGAANAFLFTRQPIYRANLKLLVQSSGNGFPRDGTEETAASFIATQCDIMMGQPLLQRVQQRLKKTPEEVRENLVNLQIRQLHEATIILISVDSPSKNFARDFANTLADEYLKWRDEQRASIAENALLPLTCEISRLSTELKAANNRVLQYAKEHNITDISHPPTAPGAELTEFNTLKEDATRIRKIYNTLLDQLMLKDGCPFPSRMISVLEPAILEPDPVYPKKVKSLIAAAFLGLSLGLVLTAIIAAIFFSRTSNKPPPLPT